MDDLFWRLPVMAYLWVVCAALVPIFVLGGSEGGAEAAAGNKGQEAASPFCIWSNRTPFPFHHFQPRILSSNAAVFDKLFDN